MSEVLEACKPYQDGFYVLRVSGQDDSCIGKYSQLSCVVVDSSTTRVVEYPTPEIQCTII